jgi:hypothetical protein
MTEDDEDETTTVEEQQITAEPETVDNLTEQPAPAAAPAPITPVDTNPLTSDPYDFEACTIAIQVMLLPSDGHQQGREVVIAVRNHQDMPIIRAFRLADVSLASPITDLLEELRADLATRAAAKQQREAEAAAVKQKQAEESAARSAKAKQTQKPAPAKPEPKPEPAKVGKEPSKAQLSLFG